MLSYPIENGMFRQRGGDEMQAVKETKAQRAERLKASLNPWTAFAEIERFAREGYQSIPPEWLNTYFRWWGIYTQGDGVGAVGGTGGEGKSVPYFMTRIRVPNGFVRAEQLRTIADLAERHARGVADVTVRQNFQFHWVTIEALPDIIRRLDAVGITTLGTCGDVTRNITGCPVAGIDGDEIADASDLVREVTDRLNGSSDFYNLPRKYKMSISGCRAWCTYPEINDVGLTAIRHPERDEVGFSIRVGGGLSTEPHFAERLDAFVQWGEAAAVVEAVSAIFRDSDVLRENREKARLKYLFLRHGWTPASFLAELERRLGRPLERAVPETPPDDVYRDHVGIHAQKQAGLVYAGLAVPRGRLSAGQLRAVAETAERLGDGTLRATVMQNLLVLNIRRANAPAVERALSAVGLRAGGSPFLRGTVACTGTEFCKLALTETKGFASWLVESLQERLPGFDQHLRINVTGCPNGCGQHWIADLGLDGKKTKIDGQVVDAYQFSIGGAVGGQRSFARPTGVRVPARDVPAAIERLLRAYLAERHSDENFRQFAARHTDAALARLLTGQAPPLEVAGTTRGPVEQWI
jgi:sulfite reductase (ferredoxin)